jgi:uncharacterized protein (DUF58 family)
LNAKLLTQLFSLRDLRNAAVAAVTIIGGIGLSLLTLYAHQSGNIRLAGISAAVSLAFVVLILIFVVPPLARNAGREASQMNLPFEFTTGGAIMLALVTIVGFSAWNTGNNLLFIVLSFLVATMIVGFFAGSISLKKLDVKMRFPEMIFAGQPTRLLVSLHTRKRLFPAFSVVAEVRGKERDRSIADRELRAILPAWIAKRVGKPPLVRRTLNHFVFVRRREDIEARIEHVFPSRGRLLIEDFELSTKFPFGFFRHRRRLPARETELFVLPQPTSVGLEREEMPFNAGQIIGSRRGVGQDLLALRDYQPNDDIRHIDWKATARTRLLTVREFAAEDDRQVTVHLDTLLPADVDKRPNLRDLITAEQSGKTVVLSRRFESGVGLCAGIISQLIEENATVRLIVGDDSGDFGSGRQHLYESLKRLAVAEPVFAEIEAEGEHHLAPERITEDEDISHWYLITSDSSRAAEPEGVRTLKIITF